MMIGRLQFPFRERTATAVLEEDGRWRCPEVPAVVRVLDILYSPARDGQPDVGPPARHHLDAAARWLRGTVEAEALGRN